ncbi:MAG: hypothetical protein AAI978_00445 [Candidatus Hodgkinia cicadicola]
MISVRRTTLETDIVASLCVNGKGRWHGTTNIGLFDHLLCQFAAHSLADLKLFCNGDLWTDWHHTVEDVGIVLGLLVARTLNNANRFSFVTVPMDNSLITLSADFSGRPCLCWQQPRFAQSASDAIRISHVFFDALARSCEATVHVDIIRADDQHHCAEALFKALGVCYKLAFYRTSDVSVSTKGKPKIRWR